MKDHYYCRNEAGPCDMERYINWGTWYEAKSYLVRVWFATMIALALLIASLLYAKAADAGEHNHEALGEVGAFYETWMRMPDRSNSCCNKIDCYETIIKPDGKGGHVFLHRETQTWVLIPNDKLEDNATDARDSPNGMSHVCASPVLGGLNGETYINVFCAVRGSGG